MARKTRYEANGKVFFAEVSNTEAVLKNLSNSGLCIETPGFLEVVPKGRFSLNIVPEEESNLNQFDLEVESRWVKAKMKTSESGFVIVVPPDTSVEALLEQYLQFLATKPCNNISDDIDSEQE